MADIVGTIISVEDFLSTDKTDITMMIKGTRYSVLELAAGRKYIIPDFQREIRWKKENLIELINDVKNGVKFLGNIILTQKNDGNMEIIDGQQRITTILMLIGYIRNRHGKDLNIINTCDLNNQNFKLFNILQLHNFNMEEIEDDDLKEEIVKSDYFNQRVNYINLWKTMEEMDILTIKSNADQFYKNLKRCKLNIITNTEDTLDSSIEYFLDVNLKGVKLDTEDIFKGQLFSQNGNDSIRESWKELKILTFRLNAYPLLDILKHYFYCDLYNDSKFEKVDFDQKFNIKKSVVVDGALYLSGEHLIRVIHSTSYMQNSLDSINKSLKIMLDIIETESPSNKFKESFSAAIDNTHIKICHNFLKKIITDSFQVPKVLALKYINDVLLNRDANKADYKKIYGIYLLTVFFVIFDNKKTSKEIFSIVKSDDWYSHLITQVKKYVSQGEISRSKISALNQFGHKNDEEDEWLRCKSLAVVYNFFELKSNSVNIIDGKWDDLLKFINDKNVFSLEHFVVNNSKTCVFYPEDEVYKKEYIYQKITRDYSKSLFNFIFIEKILNQDLGNLHITEKIKMIKNTGVQFNCEYSKMVFGIAENTLDSYPVISRVMNEDNANEILDKYYQEEFIDLYMGFAEQIIENVIEQFKD